MLTMLALMLLPDVTVARPPVPKEVSGLPSAELKRATKPAWRVTEFDLYRNWKWIGDFLWLTIYYDHRFEELNPTQTKITFELEAKGFCRSFLGRLFARIYSRTLDRAIALLVQEMNATSANV
jgi:hypothetical protein